MLNAITSLLSRRPAESTTSVASIVAAVLLAVFHVKDDTLLVPLALALGHVPAAVTWVVELLRRRAAPSATKPAGS